MRRDGWARQMGSGGPRGSAAALGHATALRSGRPAAGSEGRSSADDQMNSHAAPGLWSPEPVSAAAGRDGARTSMAAAATAAMPRITKRRIVTLPADSDACGGPFGCSCSLYWRTAVGAMDRRYRTVVDSVRTRSADPPYDSHTRAVEALRRRYESLPPGAPVRLAKSTSNLFRFGRERGGPRLDVAAFHRVLDVDPRARTAD